MRVSKGKRVRGGQARDDRSDCDGAVQSHAGVAGRLRFGLAHRAFAVDHLSVQIALLHRIVVHDREPAHPGSREVEADRRAQTARADDEHGAITPALLRGDAKLGHDELAAVTADLAPGQRVAARVDARRALELGYSG